MTLFDFPIGDELLVLGDEGEGIAIIKKDEFLKNMYELFNTIQDR